MCPVALPGVRGARLRGDARGGFPPRSSPASAVARSQISAASHVARLPRLASRDRLEIRVAKLQGRPFARRASCARGFPPSGGRAPRPRGGSPRSPSDPSRRSLRNRSTCAHGWGRLTAGRLRRRDVRRPSAQLPTAFCRTSSVGGAHVDEASRFPRRAASPPSSAPRPRAHRPAASAESARSARARSRSGRRASSSRRRSWPGTCWARRPRRPSGRWSPGCAP